MKNRVFMIALAVLLMISMLSLAGCGKEEPAPTAAPTQAPTEVPTEAPTEAPTEPAPTEPAWVPGVARATFAEAIYGLLNKGEEVEVTGKYAHYYIITAEPYDLLVDERYIRLESEEPFETDTWYARSNRPVFDSVYMRNEPIATLRGSTEVTILEAKDNWVYVEWAEGKGYMLLEDVTPNRGGGGTGGGGGGGGGGGAVDGTDVDVGALSAIDIRGGVMLLGDYYGPEMESIFDAPCKGSVLADEIEAYIALYHFGEEMKVLDYNDEFCTVYLNTDLTANVRRFFAKLEGDVEEEPFTGYIRRNHTVLYKEYQLRREAMELNTNDTVEVLYTLPAHMYGGEEIYVVSVDGEILYVQVSEVSDTEVKVYAGGGGGGGGGSSGGAVWTPPMM